MEHELLGPSLALCLIQRVYCLNSAGSRLVPAESANVCARLCTSHKVGASLGQDQLKRRSVGLCVEMMSALRYRSLSVIQYGQL